MDQAKKKQTKKIVTWCLLAALVAGLAAMPLLAKAEAEADGPVATVHSGTVEAGSIRTALHGGGTLTTEDIEDIRLPSGVKITEFLVKNGDTVTAGTPLAAVDKVSVMTAITSVEDTMAYLQEEMKSAREEKVGSTISATAGGRVKKVFAQKGDSVQEVMLRDGALALLSLDGLMAVEIEKKLEILTGETVTVTLADGEDVTGRVASNLDGVIVITLEDQGYAIGETVTVTKKDGSEVGTGELYVYNAWKATAFSGMIQTAPAREETKVTAGTTLFTLTDTDFRGQLEYLASLHRDYEEQMQELFQMYNTGTIDAPCDGMVSGIDRDSPHLLASVMEEDLEASLLNAEEGSWKVVLLSEEEPDPPSSTHCNPDAGENCPEEDPAKHLPNCLKACQNSSTCTATGKHYKECIGSCTAGAVCGASYHKSDCIGACDRGNTDAECNGTKHHHSDCIKCCEKVSDETRKCPSTKHYPNCIALCNPLNPACPALIHKKACIKSCDHADINETCDADPNHYLDCIYSCINSDSAAKECPAIRHKETCHFAAMTYRAKVAIVTAVGRNALVVRWDASGQEYPVEKTATGWQFAADPDFNVDLLVNKGPDVTVSNPSAYKPGDVIFVINGYKGNELEWTGVSVFMRVSGKADMDLDFNLEDLTDSLMGMMTPQIDLSALMGQFAGFGNFGFYAPSPVEEAKLFDLEGSTLMTISPQDTVSLTISLDQQDIAKVSVGQKATVKVEALAGETFQAEVTQVGNRGTSSGGSSKFTAKLELPKAKDMLDGMSATATLPLLEKTGVPTIPVVALEDQGSQTVVYTALDKEGQPANPVPVTIGISDGLTAEILSGLEVGDPYHYRYYDVMEEDTGVEERFTLT